MPHGADATVPVAAVVLGDNLEVIARLPDGCCDLIYADPPFDLSTRRHPRLASGDDADADAGDGAIGRFLAFLRPRLAQMHRVLAESGSIYVHLDWRTVHHVKVLMDGLFGPRQFLNEIIWSYRSGSRPSRWFPRKHDTILLYAKKTGRHTFHHRRAGAYRTRDLRVDGEGRPFKTTRRGPLYFHPDGPMVSDVWDIPFLSTVSAERVDYPSQKPAALLERIITASSNEGDLVADFFCGTGTTAVVAERLRRRWIACDDHPRAVEITRRRLATFGKATGS